MARGFPPLAALPNLSLSEGQSEDVNAAQVVETWLASLQELFDKKDFSRVPDLFVKEAWWRDVVALRWDYSSKNGPDAIAEYISGSTAGFGQLKVETYDHPALAPQLEKNMGPARFAMSTFTFQTKFGRGRGVVRLVNTGPDQWKAWTISTHLCELTAKAQDETEEGLQVLIIGAGQAGLILAAHLKKLGLSFQLIEKTPRIGDVWRNRYENLRIHSPKFIDHYPFLPNPDSHPLYPSGHEAADWAKKYAKDMDLEKHVLFNTVVTKVDLVESDLYHVTTQEVSSDEQKTLKAKQVVIATGLWTGMNRPDFTGEASFRGQIYHSSDHKTASDIADLANKKVVVIGCGNSGHDIAEDFVQHGAQAVTMIQRSPIYAVSLPAMEQVVLAMWNTPGISTEDADLLGGSFPLAVVRKLAIGMSQAMAQIDKDLLDGLEKAGMAVLRGNDGSSLVDYQFLVGGSSYFDTGACKLIIDGRIKVHMCKDGVREFYSDGLILADGTKVEADVVVLATGLQWNLGPSYMEELLGPKLAAKIHKGTGHIDGSEFERTGVWRPVGIPGLWTTLGSWIWARQNSLPLALQIQAFDIGLNGCSEK